jgi:uncharacterized membrane protein YcaP (DUF421 family)
MQLLVSIFGEGRDLSVLQMSFRAVVVFLLALLMLRITGQRTFGQKTAVDQVVMIILGAVLSRGVTGSSMAGNKFMFTTGIENSYPTIFYPMENQKE